MREKYTIENFESYIYKTAQYIIIENDLKNEKKRGRSEVVAATLTDIYKNCEWIDSLETELLTINCCCSRVLHRAISEVQHHWKEEMSEGLYIRRISMTILTLTLSEKVAFLLAEQ